MNYTIQEVTMHLLDVLLLCTLGIAGALDSGSSYLAT